jgi:asparagine synthase (glutamine-hydrolysing)
MCGIAGIVSVYQENVYQSRIKAMTDVIKHRGPDAEGIWISENGNVGLGHRRLSIIDLTEDANQPMHFRDRYSIIFNGEIYNYIELKESLIQKGYIFKTESDTEVLMALYDYEKEKCLFLLDGMFSFVIYDHNTNKLFGARDRFGEKPFYYNYKKGSHFMFGSEMKCLWAAGVKKEVNNRMLFAYLNYGTLQNSKDFGETFYINCQNLPHGHYFELDVTSCQLRIKKYYKLNFEFIDESVSESDVKEKFQHLFYESVKRRLRSDVPVGSSLSGGLDSSLIVCAIHELQKGNCKCINTFSAVFPGFVKDERKYIEHVLQQTHASGHFTTPNENELLKDLDTLLWHQEEPFTTGSIYAQFCVMRFAKENNVTVLLDGQGADEYLAGYHGYYQPYFNELNSKYEHLEKEQYNAYLNLHGRNSINGVLKKDLKFWARHKMPGLVKTGKNLENYFYNQKSSFFSHDFYQENIRNNGVPYEYHNTLNEALYHHLYEGELQSLLRYCDRNSMSQSIEVRLPFLSHELVEFVFSLPLFFKINKGWTKWIMRAAFSNLLPDEIVWRKDKIGYEPPQNKWFQNKNVQEKFYESKRKLFDKNIISKKEFERKITLGDSIESNRKTWSLYMASEMF